MTDGRADGRGELKKLGKNSVVYFVTNVLVRSLGFLLLPLYSRALSPEDYGIMSLAGTVRSLAGMVIALAIHGAIVPLHNRAANEEERRRLYGTILVFLLVVPPVLTGLLDLGGRIGLLDVFRSVPFRPYIELGIWGGCASVFQEVPGGIFIAREKPWGVMAFSVFSAIQATLWTVLFVVVLHEGAAGSLRANIAAMSTNAVFTLVVVGRMASFRVSMKLLKQALAITVPLIPHLFSHWLLAAVDRVILEENVSTDDLGRYSLGAQFADIERMVVQSVLTALSPIILRRLKADERDLNVPRLGTYAVLIMAIASLGAALLARDMLAIMTPPAYHAAGNMIPWLVLGVAIQGVYGIFTMSFWHVANTKLMPVLTAVAGIINVGVILLLIPYLGVLAAPISIAASYAVLAITYGIAGHRLFPIAWEYRRWAIIGIPAVGWFFAGELASDLPLYASIPIKLAITLVAYPLTLLALRFATAGEIAELRVQLRRLPFLGRAA